MAGSRSISHHVGGDERFHAANVPGYTNSATIQCNPLPDSFGEIWGGKRQPACCHDTYLSHRYMLLTKYLEADIAEPVAPSAAPRVDAEPGFARPIAAAVLPC